MLTLKVKCSLFQLFIKYMQIGDSLWQSQACNVFTIVYEDICIELSYYIHLYSVRVCPFKTLWVFTNGTLSKSSKKVFWQLFNIWKLFLQDIKSFLYFGTYLLLIIKHGFCFHFMSHLLFYKNCWTLSYIYFLIIITESSTNNW